MQLMAAAAVVAAAAPEPAALAITGPEIGEVRYSVSELRSMERTTAEWSFRGAMLRCEGVALHTLLSKAGAPSGAAIRGPMTATVVLAVGRDGYAAAFGIGEMDPQLGARAILVADRCNGEDIAAEGPLRLIVPTDARGARSVRNLVALEVRRLASTTVTSR